MKAKNEELSQLKSDIDSIEKEVNTYKEDIDVVSIKDFSKLITEHL